MAWQDLESWALTDEAVQVKQELVAFGVSEPLAHEMTLVYLGDEAWRPLKEEIWKSDLTA